MSSTVDYSQVYCCTSILASSAFDSKLRLSHSILWVVNHEKCITPSNFTKVIVSPECSEEEGEEEGERGEEEEEQEEEEGEEEDPLPV